MKFVILLVGMAIVAWLLATQIKHGTHVSVNGVDQGTPKQIIDHAQESVQKSMQLEQQNAERRAAAAGVGP